MSKANDLTGKRFGRLLVVGRADNDSKGNTMWECVCDCGNRITTHGYCLTGGTAKSCGCTRKEKISKFNTETKRTHGEMGHDFRAEREQTALQAQKEEKRT